MKHLAAYLLLDAAGKKPSAKDIKNLLQSVGIEADKDKLNVLLTELEGKNINELIAEGQSKLASVPTGGVAASGGGTGGDTGGATGGGEAPPTEEAKEEEEESDGDMGFGLFD
ncbi:4092_t:CDS:2 [Paraglomus brasilianum]|uniref:4092_t:CDS:1 n=1 Tax=Paraglomus brasilianum TaxID=144538 RepID=A0A9N9CP05_9GLOM|nr:4092_t:CDS:2 [Paraglomus brasilianum]